MSALRARAWQLQSPEKDIAVRDITTGRTGLLTNSEMVVLQSGNETLQKLKSSLAALRQSGWHHSAWTHRKIVHSSPNKVHINTRFTRYRVDGSIIASYDSLYIVTLEHGRWAVKMRSSFA